MKKRKQTKKNILILLSLILSTIYGLYYDELSTTFALPVFKQTNSTLTVYYVDVGQADSILIENQNEFMLIDAGNNEDGQLLTNYFQSLGIKNFKYVVGTHPHEDHIGGLDDIIKTFSIENIYIPDATTTTTTFIDILDAMEEKNLNYQVPEIGSKFNLGEAKVEVIYTGTDESDLNNTSIVLKLTFNSHSFLFTGDATDKTEEEILAQNINIKADVLKIGHHGSKYSTTTEFLKKVNPKYAIISVGKNNTYNHPNKSTLNKLKNNNIEIHRTDQEGTIIISSDGKKLTITNEKTNTNGG